jgi:hypothetical protein
VSRCGKCRRPIVRSKGNLPREACRCLSIKVQPVTPFVVRLYLGKVDRRKLWVRALEARAQ